MSRPLNRRTFLQGVTAAAVVATQSRTARAVSANDKVILAVVGLRGRGSALAPNFASRPDCEVAYLCDCDTQFFDERNKAVAEAQGRAAKTVQDIRRVLDDRSVDAIVVATPDHWHALATVWGCQAGKDVYVEKPVSHTPWEGRKMVEAVREIQPHRPGWHAEPQRGIQSPRQGIHRQRQAGHGPYGPRDQSEGLAERARLPRYRSSGKS